MALVGAAVGIVRSSPLAADTVLVTAPEVSEEGVLGRVLRIPAPYSGTVTTVAADVRLHEEGTIAL